MARELGMRRGSQHVTSLMPAGSTDADKVADRVTPTS
jgi:hypothetical protein